jgi:hypothetical protein
MIKNITILIFFLILLILSSCSLSRKQRIYNIVKEAREFCEDDYHVEIWKGTYSYRITCPNNGKVLEVEYNQ